MSWCVRLRGLERRVLTVVRAYALTPWRVCRRELLLGDVNADEGSDSGTWRGMIGRNGPP